MSCASALGLDLLGRATGADGGVEVVPVEAGARCLGAIVVCVCVCAGNWRLGKGIRRDEGAWACRMGGGEVWIAWRIID